jgi:hypothetical protein
MLKLKFKTSLFLWIRIFTSLVPISRFVLAEEIEVEVDFEGFSDTESDLTPFPTPTPQRDFQIRLDEEGAPMQHAHVVDQQDLGICAPTAVTTALMAFQTTSKPLSFIKSALDSILIPEGAAVFFGKSWTKNKTSHSFSILRNDFSEDPAHKSKSEPEILSWWGYNRDRTWLTVENYNRGKFVRTSQEAELLGKGKKTLGQSLSDIYNSIENIKALNTKPIVAAELLSQQIPKIPFPIAHEIFETRLDSAKMTSLVWQKIFPQVRVDPQNQVSITFGKPSNAKDIENGIRSHFLSMGTSPIGLDYCSQYLYQGNQYKAVTSRGSLFTKIRAQVRKDCGFHSSVAVGYRFNTETSIEEILIQNSWGKGCSLYHRDFSCESGKIWVPLESLKHNVLNYWKIRTI